MKELPRGYPLMKAGLQVGEVHGVEM